MATLSSIGALLYTSTLNRYSCTSISRNGSKHEQMADPTVQHHCLFRMLWTCSSCRHWEIKHCTQYAFLLSSTGPIMSALLLTVTPRSYSVGIGIPSRLLGCFRHFTWSLFDCSWLAIHFIRLLSVFPRLFSVSLGFYLVAIRIPSRELCYFRYPSESIRLLSVFPRGYSITFGISWCPLPSY